MLIIQKYFSLTRQKQFIILFFQTDLQLKEASAVETNEKPTNKNVEDIMSVLLQHEVRDSAGAANAAAKSLPGHENSDSSDDEMKRFDNDYKEGKVHFSVFIFSVTSHF